MSASKFSFPLLLALGVAAAGVATAGAAAAPFPAPWINAAGGPEPVMQVQQYDADTYVLRQSIRTNFEGPFIYLFFGARKVLEIDTGAGGTKVRPTIDKVIADWTRTHGGKPLQLIVAHSHSHGDHVAGDSEFAGRPDTTVIGHAPQEVAAFFHIKSWPEEIAPFDLGGRTLDIIPAPGHEPAEIAVFDERTRILMTGDELYSGRLYIPNGEFPTLCKSIDRVVNFTKDKHVSWVMGTHIEMTLTPKRDYAFDAAGHPQEHPLELPYSTLLELQSALHAMGEKPRLDVHNDFIVYPLP